MPRPRCRRSSAAKRRTPQIAAFLTALAHEGRDRRGAGRLRARHARGWPRRSIAGLNGAALLDTCGTGGDRSDTFNISTVAAFVVAGAGVHVAKHGNRSISSKCGSADLLDAMGIRIALPPEQSARAIREVGIGFLFAPAVHTAMRHAQPVRVELKMRTVFNLLGPLTNPAGANAQLVGRAVGACRGVDGRRAGGAWDCARGFVVHGSDGLDEITTTGPTLAFEIRDGAVERRTLEPADFGVPIAAPRQRLKGGDPRQNLEIANARPRRRPRAAARYRARECRGGAGRGRARPSLPRRSRARGGLDRLRRGARQSRSSRSEFTCFL